MELQYAKKLIEVALPLDAINNASAREKSIRYGHPSTLHLWWARRPLAAARAVIFAQMVDDPWSRPELFPTAEDQDQERGRLFDIIEKLLKSIDTPRLPSVRRAVLVGNRISPGNPVTKPDGAVRYARSGFVGCPEPDGSRPACAIRASRRLRAQDGLMTAYGATLLRIELDRVPLPLPAAAQGPGGPVAQHRRWCVPDHLGTGNLRLRRELRRRCRTLSRAARAGIGSPCPIQVAPGLLVKPAVARQQLDAGVPQSSGDDLKPGSAPSGKDGMGVGGDTGGIAHDPPPLKRFHGTVTLNPTRVGRDASQIADEVIAHLAALVGANLTVTLEIEAEIPDGAPRHVVRTVTENSCALNFTDQGFEREYALTARRESPMDEPSSAKTDELKETSPKISDCDLEGRKKSS